MAWSMRPLQCLGSALSRSHQSALTKSPMSAGQRLKRLCCLHVFITTRMSSTTSRMPGSPGAGWPSAGTKTRSIPGQYFLAPVAGENMIVVRGNDGELRAFYNVCRHRGARLWKRHQAHCRAFQCPYHAWVYDLDGNLKQPRHTELLVDFDPVEWGLVPVTSRVLAGHRLHRPVRRGPAAARVSWRHRHRVCTLRPWRTAPRPPH